MAQLTTATPTSTPTTTPIVTSEQQHRQHHSHACIQQEKVQHAACTTTTTTQSTETTTKMTKTIITPTPTKRRKKERLRIDGSPVIKTLQYNTANMPTKIVYLIRHGESLGQVAAMHGLNRKTDPTLIDCGLTQLGQQQATKLCDYFQNENASIQLVLSSPLTRALHTAILAFPDKPILVQYDLREVGSAKVPENCPRRMEFVIDDLQSYITQHQSTIDYESLQPNDWPRDYSPIVVRKDRVRQVFRWLYHQRPETCIAVVCHYNVICSAIVDGKSIIRPQNATPIPCTLYPNGELMLKEYKKKYI